MKLAQDYLTTIEKKLRKLGTKIDEINAKAQTETKQKYEENVQKTKTKMNETFAKVNDSIETELRKWGQKIEKLTDKAKQEAKAEYDETVKNLRPKIDDFKTEVGRMKDSGGDAWAEIRTGSVNAWKELKGSFASAVGKLKERKKADVPAQEGDGSEGGNSGN